MRRYEYYFWYQKTPTFNINKEKTNRLIEAEWQRLGREGWKYCCTVWEAVVFIREVE